MLFYEIWTLFSLFSPFPENSKWILLNRAAKVQLFYKPYNMHLN